MDFVVVQRKASLGGILASGAPPFYYLYGGNQSALGTPATEAREVTSMSMAASVNTFCLLE